MKTGKENEMLFILSVLKSPEIEYNANNLAKHLKLSAMGSLKIAKRLQKEEILSAKKIGQASIYKINSNKDYALEYSRFLLKKEAQDSNPYIKRWINEIRKIKSAKSAIIFGSVFQKNDKANDIDVLFIVEQRNLQKLKNEIEEINLLNSKKIHPIFQAEIDLENNIRKKDGVILNAIKGVVVFGEDHIIKQLIK